MQKIGEHLDSGDDTSICAAPVTSPLQFLPCGGVRPTGHLPSCLAEARSTGTGPWNRRPGLACQPESLSLSPSLASQVLITAPLVSLTLPGTVPRMMPLTPISLSNPRVRVAPSSQQRTSLQQHQIPINGLPAFVPCLAAAASMSASSSVKSARCLCCATLSVLL